jgi:hypothetical protein
MQTATSTIPQRHHQIWGEDTQYATAQSISPQQIWGEDTQYATAQSISPQLDEHGKKFIQ